VVHNTISRSTPNSSPTEVSPNNRFLSTKESPIVSTPAQNSLKNPNLLHVIVKLSRILRAGITDKEMAVGLSDY
jgi:hypothetical protein